MVFNEGVAGCVKGVRVYDVSSSPMSNLCEYIKDFSLNHFHCWLDFPSRFSVDLYCDSFFVVFNEGSVSEAILLKDNFDGFFFFRTKKHF